MTNIDLSQIGGTQTWTEAMAKEMERLGHDVTIWSPRVGEFARERLADFDVTDALPIQSFDLCLVNHNICLDAIQPISGRKILTCHGPTHSLERPIPGADAYVAVSEEIAEAHPEYDFTVIRNGIDLERFLPAEPTLRLEPRALIFTKNAEVQTMAAEACGLAGFTWGLANYQTNPIYNVEDLLPGFDIIITSGRGCYEALACDKSTIVLARRPENGRWAVHSDGWATEDNIHDLIRHNCSGRMKKEQWGSAELAEHLAMWKGPEVWGRDFILEHHNIRKSAEHYLSMIPKEVAA